MSCPALTRMRASVWAPRQPGLPAPGSGCRGLARGRPVQDEIEDVAEARSGRDEGARIELRAFEQQGQLRPALPAILRVAADRGARQVADDIARRRRCRARSTAASGRRTRRRPWRRTAGRCPSPSRGSAPRSCRAGSRLPSNVGASGGPETTPCSSPRLPPGMPRRNSSISSLSCGAGERQAQIADGFAADVGLIDGEGRARAAFGRQQVAHARWQAG